MVAPIGAPITAAVSKYKPMRKLVSFSFKKVIEAPEEVQMTAMRDVARA